MDLQDQVIYERDGIEYTLADISNLNQLRYAISQDVGDFLYYITYFPQMVSALMTPDQVKVVIHNFSENLPTENCQNLLAC